MNKNLIKVWAVGALLATTACSKMGNEVITEDPSYKIDANEVYVEKPTKFTYNTDNIIRNESGTEVSLSATMLNGNAVLDITEVPFTFKLRRAVDKDITITLEQDELLLSKYVGDKTGLVAFPEGTFTGLSFTIPAGQTSATTKVKIQNPSSLTATPGYIAAFAIKSSTDSNIAVSAISQAIYVKLGVSKNNAVLIPEKDTNWVEVSTDDFYLESETATSNVARLTDGRISSSWTTTSDAILYGTAYGTLKLAGIELVTRNTYSKRTPKSFKIISWYSDGTEREESIEVPAVQDVVYVKFNRPASITNFALYDFLSYFTVSNSVDIYEVRLYTTR